MPSCYACGRYVATSANSCPGCGADHGRLAATYEFATPRGSWRSCGLFLVGLTLGAAIFFVLLDQLQSRMRWSWGEALMAAWFTAAIFVVIWNRKLC